MFLPLIPVENILIFQFYTLKGISKRLKLHSEFYSGKVELLKIIYTGISVCIQPILIFIKCRLHFSTKLS